MAIALEGLGYETGLDIDKLEGVAAYFLPIRNRLLDEGRLNARVMGVDPKALVYQIPGGMLSNMLANLKDMHVEEKFPEVLAEVPHVRADLGYPPLVRSPFNFTKFITPPNSLFLAYHYNKNIFLFCKYFVYIWICKLALVFCIL